MLHYIEVVSDGHLFHTFMDLRSVCAATAARDSQTRSEGVCPPGPENKHRYNTEDQHLARTLRLGLPAELPTCGPNTPPKPLAMFLPTQFLGAGRRDSGFPSLPFLRPFSPASTEPCRAGPNSPPGRHAKRTSGTHGLQRATACQGFLVVQEPH